mmetsp:Transcript_75467/g.133612  ORF Transcript_75467/g.133612 Transcript_75467/m.133612 type:complete len:256 (-) Transcript_75467:260-1027(-)
MFAMSGGGFDDQWNMIENSACFCSGCFCFNYMCAHWSPCIFGQGKVFCVQFGNTSGAECVGEKGCLFGASKLCCIVTGASSKNCAIGCCDQFCCGSPYGEGFVVGDSNLSFMEDVFWCCYCCISGYGCAKLDPLIAQDVKLCCWESKVSCVPCHSEFGWVANHQKICCSVAQCQCPPSRTIGCGCCGIPCIKRDRRPQFRSPPLVVRASYPQQEMAFAVQQQQIVGPYPQQQMVGPYPQQVMASPPVVATQAVRV